MLYVLISFHGVDPFDITNCPFQLTKLSLNAVVG